MPPKSPDSCSTLKDIADILFKEFKKEERDRDFDAIIIMGQIALELTPLDHPHRHSALIDLAGHLSERFNKEGRTEDLDELIAIAEAIGLARTALSICPPGHPDRALTRDHLASYVQTK
ncbi:hypothetical protein PISMIDRAFT_115592, partial [Pisolithus microcarpus 441]